MFERERAINQFLLGGFELVMADIPESRIAERPPGNGHPPLWVLGHLAICAELGLNFCGQEMNHPEWMPVFGPGSSDEIQSPENYSKELFMKEIPEGYAKLGQATESVDKADFDSPHQVALLDNSSIKTKGELIGHLITSHVAFHMAQLSCWRGAAGHGPIF